MGGRCTGPRGLLTTTFGASYSAWSYYRTVTLNPGNGVPAESNYPLLVRLSSSDAVWANCNSNGYDIRFTASDGTTALSFQRSYWNYSTTSGAAEFWVLLPAVNAAGTPTTFRMYWGNVAATDASSGSSVFSSGNYSQRRMAHESDYGNKRARCDRICHKPDRCSHRNADYHNRSRRCPVKRWEELIGG